MGVLWKLEPATAAKHRLYKRYLDAWWPILLQPSATGFLRPRVTYVDAFAGPGEYEDHEEGSPVFAIDRLLNHAAVTRMQLRRERVCMVFMERDRARYGHLCKVLTSRFGPLKDLPINVVVRHGEAGRDLTGMLDELNVWGHPILAIFDGWGNVNVPFGLAERIGRNRSSEVITTFGPNWFSRREHLNTSELDSVFGSRIHWEPADRESRSDERWRVWLSTYREALGRAGFGYRLQFEVVPKTGQPLYLVYGTRHEKGVEVMKAAMWEVDGSDGMVFRDPRTRGAAPLGQASLWEAGKIAQPELLELVMQRLSNGPTSMDDLEQWLLLETSRWRRQDAKVAVNDLRADGLVITEPSGRLTRKSVVRLR